MEENRLFEILEAYAVETPDGNDHEILSAWIQRYPEFESEILDFAAARAVIRQTLDPQISATDESRARESGLTLLREFLYHDTSTKTAIESLAGFAKAKGLDKPSFAAALGVSVSLLMYLEKKRLSFSTIPAAFVARIAATLQVAEKDIAAYLNQGPSVSVASFKSQTRPGETQQKSFAEAVREDQSLSSEQKKALCDL